ncbi:hypothetical protein HYR65_03275 [Candidatus Azambacteria bacterium]|nr:hypothetical protein [Candidatus Azambacteria bacterium]
MLFLFGVLLFAFNGFIAHPYYIDVLALILLAVPVMGFVYLLKFPNANTTPFYILFSALLGAYTLIFIIVRVYDIFNRI